MRAVSPRRSGSFGKMDDRGRSRSRSRSPRSGRRQDRRSKMIYLSNLPYETRWVELKNILREQGGELNWVDILEDANGRSKGCAVAEFKNSDAAEACIRCMTPRFEMNGRNVIVKDIRDPISFFRKIKEETGIDYLSRGGRSRNAPSAGNPRPADYETFGLSMDFLRSHGIDLPLVDRIFIANVPFTVGSGRLCDIFGMAGRIKWIDLQMDKEGRSKGSAVIEYSHPLEAVQAISMFNQQKLLDRSLLVKLDRFTKIDEHKPGELPRGLLSVGMGLGADGAPLKDVSSVLMSLGKEYVVAPAVQAVSMQPVVAFGGSFGTTAAMPMGVPSVNSNPFGISNLGSNSVLPARSGLDRGASSFRSNAFGGSTEPFGSGSASFGGVSSFSNGSVSAKLEPPPSAFGGSSNTGYSTRTIIIKNLPHDYTWQIVSDRVASFGDVEGVEMVGPGVARVRYANVSDAERARATLSGTVVEGRAIHVEYVY